MRQRRSLFKDKKINTSGRCNNHKIYALNIGTPKYFNQILTDMKGETV